MTQSLTNQGAGISIINWVFTLKWIWICLFLESLCDAVLLNSNNQSSHYRLHNRKFQFMIDAQRKVTVLLTSGSLDTSSRYEIIIGSAEDNRLKLKRIKGNITADLLVKNVTGPLKENEMRSFWIEVETDRVVFGSGEVVCLTDYMISFLQERNYLVDISYLRYGCCDAFHARPSPIPSCMIRLWVFERVIAPSTSVIFLSKIIVIVILIFETLSRLWHNIKVQWFKVFFILGLSSAAEPLLGGHLGSNDK